MIPKRSALKGFGSGLTGGLSRGAPRETPDDGHVGNALVRSERAVAGVVFERALISAHEAAQARARALSLADADICGRSFDIAVSAIREQCSGSTAYAYELLSVIADEAHLPAGQARERFLDVIIPKIAAQHDRRDDVTSRDVRRARTIARKIIHYANDVPNALTRLLGLSGQLPGLLVRLAGPPDATNASAQDTIDIAFDTLNALGRAAGPRRSAHRDGIFERPMLCISLDDISPSFSSVPGTDAEQDALRQILALVGEARRADVVLVLDASDEARLEATVALFLKARNTAAAAGWDGVGISIAAESKRALETLHRLYRSAVPNDAKIPVRLAHSATVATDLTWAAASGLADYPTLVSPAIASTSYVACARAMLSERSVFHPVFDGAMPAERALIEAMAAGQPYDLIVASHTLAMSSRSGTQTVGDGRERIGLEVGDADAVLARWRDTAAVPRLIAALGAETDGASDVARTAYFTRPLDPVGDIGRLLDPQDDDSTPPPAVVSLRAPNASTDGAFLAVRDPVDQPGDTFNSRRPAEETADSGSGRKGDAEAGISAPFAPRTGWAITPPQARVACLYAAADGLHPRKTELVDALLRTGLTARHAEAEWLCIVETLRAVAAAWSDDQTKSGAAGVTLVSQGGADVGRVGIACDPSHLFQEAVQQVAEALAAGNVVKCLVPPGAAGPLLTVHLALLDAGLPEGSLHISDARAEGVELSSFVAEHQSLVVCGGNDLQSRVLRAQAQTGAAMQPVQKFSAQPSLAIVDGTASLCQAAASITASLAAFAGQRLGTPRTLLVADDVMEALSEELVDRLARLKLGPTTASETQLGPMLLDELRDAAHAEKRRLMQEANLIFDGDLPSELIAEPFVSPALFAAVDSSALIVPQALGPLIGLVPVPADDLLDINASTMGLIASVQPWHSITIFSSDDRLFDAVSSQIRCRQVMQDTVPFGTATADSFCATMGAVAPGRFLKTPDLKSASTVIRTIQHRGVVS